MIKIPQLKPITKQSLIELWPVIKKPFLISFIALIGIMILIPIFTYVYFARSLQSKEAIMNQNDSGITLLDRNNKPFFTFYEAKQKKIIPLDQIPESLRQAVIASEDNEFYNHSGFSIRGIIRAAVADVSKQGLHQGGSPLKGEKADGAGRSPTNKADSAKSRSLADFPKYVRAACSAPKAPSPK